MCPYQRGGHIRKVVILERWSYFRGSRIGEAAVLERWPYWRILPYQRGGHIKKVSILENITIQRGGHIREAAILESGHIRETAVLERWPNQRILPYQIGGHIREICYISKESGLERQPYYQTDVWMSRLQRSVHIRRFCIREGPNQGGAIIREVSVIQRCICTSAVGELEYLVVKHICSRRCPRSYEDDADEAMKQCQILLEEPDIETAVRMGDIYGIMVEHLARQQNYSKVSLDFELCNIQISACFVNIIKHSCLFIKQYIIRGNFTNQWPQYTSKRCRIRVKLSLLKSFSIKIFSSRTIFNYLLVIVGKFAQQNIILGCVIKYMSQGEAI